MKKQKTKIRQTGQGSLSKLAIWIFLEFAKCWNESIEMTTIFCSAESKWSIITKETVGVKYIICYVACEIQTYERTFGFRVKQLPSCNSTALSKKGRWKLRQRWWGKGQRNIDWIVSIWLIRLFVSLWNRQEGQKQLITKKRFNSKEIDQLKGVFKAKIVIDT